MVIRLDNWPILFSAYLAERKAMPFKWEKNDCMAFVALGVGVVTGIDFFTQYTGYSNKAGADKMIQEHGGMMRILDGHLGAHHTNPRRAGRADVVLLKEAGEMIAGLVDENSERICCVTDAGLVKIPLSNALMIWSYGHG